MTDNEKTIKYLRRVLDEGGAIMYTPTGWQEMRDEKDCLTLVAVPEEHIKQLRRVPFNPFGPINLEVAIAVLFECK